MVLVLGCAGAVAPIPTCLDRASACIEEAHSLRDAWQRAREQAELERDAVEAMHVPFEARDAHRDDWRTVTLYLHHIEALLAELLICSGDVHAESSRIEALLRIEDERSRAGARLRRLPPREGELRALLERTSAFAGTCSP